MSMSMSIINLLVSEPAPLACHWGELVSLVKLNVLHGVAESKALHSSASDHIALVFHYW